MKVHKFGFNPPLGRAHLFHLYCYLVLLFAIPFWSSALVTVGPGKDYSTIQAAINYSSSGTEIVVYPGTYRENVKMQGKNIILRSTNPLDPAVVATTIIDGKHILYVPTVEFKGTENETCILEGFTITNGYGYIGGGIKGQGCTATIRNNRIIKNICCTCYNGGRGAGIGDCDGLIENNIIVENYAPHYGGGIWGCDGIIRNNTIVKNTSSGGGGISNSNAVIVNNIVWNNSATTNPQINQSSEPSFSCISAWSGGGTGNITSNPLFVNESGSDYHLQASSPCIDAGTLSNAALYDMEGEIRPWDITSAFRGDGSDVDMGADEYYAPTTAQFTFDTSVEEWQFAGYLPPFTQPISNTSSSRLGLNADGSSNCFSYWMSPNITIEDDVLYRSRWYVTSTATNPDGAVDFRLRINQKTSWQCWTRNVNSYHHQSPSSTSPKWYDVLFSPSVLGNGDNAVVASFDIMSFNPNNDMTSWIAIDELILEKATMQVNTQIQQYEFASGSEGWLFSGPVGSFSTASTSADHDRLGLNANGSTNCFSYWYSPDVTVQNHKYYRARFKFRSSVTDPDKAVQFRLRINQRDAWQEWDRIVNSNNQEGPYSAESTYYDVFLNPILVGGEDYLTILSFDILSFSPEDTANSWLYLETATVNEITINP